MRRILAAAIVALLAATTGCGSSTKATIPTEMGPPLGDDANGGTGGRKKGQPAANPKAKDRNDSASDG